MGALSRQDITAKPAVPGAGACPGTAPAGKGRGTRGSRRAVQNANSDCHRQRFTYPPIRRAPGGGPRRPIRIRAVHLIDVRVISMAAGAQANDWATRCGLSARCFPHDRAEGTSTDRLAVFDRGDLGHGHAGLTRPAVLGTPARKKRLFLNMPRKRLLVTVSGNSSVISTNRLRSE